MITFILKLLILIYLFYMIKFVYDMLQYNQKANLIKIEMPDKDKIALELKHKCPLLVNHLLNLDLTIESMNYRIPGYIVKDGETLLSLDQLHNSDKIYVHRNTKLITDFNLSTYHSKIEELFSNFLTCASDHYLSLYRGEQSIPLTKNYREVLLIQPISGKVIIYLFNPKHESEIKGLELKSIKKWGIKLELEKNQLLYIPPEWYYFYESKDDVILSQVEFDSYPSFLFNYIRKK